MPPLWRRARRGFYGALSLMLLAALRLLPSAAARALCVGLARGAAAVRPRDVARARANLAIALPELAPGQREELFRGAIAALGANLHDALSAPRWAAREFAGVSDDGAIAAIQALRAEGRGVLVLTGHLGCWELLGAYLASRLGGLTVATGTIRNAPIDRWVRNRRQRLGLSPVPREGDARPLLRALRRGGVVAVLMDQKTRVASLPVPFFGRPAPTPSGLARLACHTGAPVLPVAIAREGTGHRVIHLPPLRPGGESGEQSVYSLLTACNAALETLIRRNPAEWVWFHDRWGMEAR